MINISNKKHIPVLCLMFFVFCSFCLGSVSYSTPVSAYSASLTTDSSVELNVSHLGDGTDIETKSLRVVSDCRAGYNLSVATDANANLYKDGDSSESAVFTAVDGISALNSASNTNKWGYTLTNNATSATVFSPLSTTESILKTSSQTASPESDIDDTFPIYYGVKVNDSVVPGIYQMDDNRPIIYYLTMDATCNQYTVSFNANGGTGTIADQAITAGEPTKLSSASTLVAPENDSYTDADGNTITGTEGKLWTFWGWNTEIDGSGDWYKDRESVTDLTQAGDTITLYAQWEQPTLADLIPAPTPQPTDPKLIDHDTMQDMSTAACFNSVKFTAIGTPYGQTTLKDSRDGTTRTYTVAKLPDGLCWMTQNLNLGASSAITLTSDNTDLAEGTTFTLPASDPNDFATTTTQANINKATVLNNMTVPDYTVNGTTYSGKVNAYYSYAAATADTSTYSKGNVTVSTSICPKNWDLPTNTQYYNLKTAGSINNYNSNSTADNGKNAGNEPYYFIYGGYRKAAGSEINTTNFNNPTSYGYLWTANGSFPTQALGTYVFSSGLYNNTTGAGYYKYYGLSIRCVANMDEASNTITYRNTDGGATQTQKIVKGESSIINPTTTWTRTNYRLMGWDTNSSATNVVYKTGQTITPSFDITLYTVWKPSYTLQYNGNGADAGVMTNVKHTNVTEGDVFDLFASNFSKAGYGFAGWSFDQNAQPGGSAKIYGPNEAITAPAPSTPGETKTLYAVWVASAGNIQDWKGCTNMNNGDVTALTDTRDNNVYTVGKLADGNCWMMENLRLDTAGSTTASKAQGYGTGFTSLADPETANFSNSTTANTLNGSTLYSTDNITGSNQGYRFPRFNYANTNARATNPSTTDNRNTATTEHGANLSSAIYSYGNYYTWAAAKANIGDLTTVADSEAASTSICPSGWKLPYGNITGNGAESTGYYYLARALGAAASNEANPRTWRSYPNNFIYSGYISGSTVSSRGSSSYMWSATAYSGTNAYSLYFAYITSSHNTRAKTYGQTVRCVMLNPSNLYEEVASMSQGPQADPDFYNDGVNEYVGNDSDGTKQNGTKAKIYIYYGELDTDSPTYGSAGNGEAWPNYVILSSASAKNGLTTSDTCWRIIRTTGSGGVKMIYNGKWTGSTCARATTNAQYGSYTYNGTTEAHGRQAVRVGFTHNTTYANTTSTSAVAVNTLYGSSSNYSVNTGNSTANNRVYDFYNANLSNYTSILEPNAGYCNDRSSFTSTAGTTATTSFIPYIAADGTATGTTRLAYYGGYVRNLFAYTTSLECPRGAVDIYSTNTSAGGNGQLRVPAALITADEARLAGMGFDSGAETFYLRTGSEYWTMTPHSRQTRLAYEMYIDSNGGMHKGTGEVYNSKGIRPVVSLIEGTKAVSGSGTATNPWIVNPASNVYTVHFDANGGSGTMSDQAITYGTATNLSSNNFTTPNANYVFGGWNTAANGSGTSYSNTQSVTSIASAGQTITLYAQWDCVGGYVCYDDNGANSTTTMSKQAIGASDTSVTFWASNFQRAGYGFAGWNTRADGTGTNYGPNYILSITAGQHASKGIKLYANWITPAKDSDDIILTFQSANLLSTTLKDGDTLSSKPIGYVTALKDQRDNQVYAVAKLADGNYWMIENLRITDTNTLGSTNKALAQSYQNSSVYGNFIGLPNSGNCFKETPCWNNLYHGFSSEGGAIVIGTNNDPYARTPNYNSDNVTNTSSNMTAAYNGTNHIYSVGNYYNWPAAMANTSYYTTETKNTSICPKGWRIPYGGTGTGTGGGNTSGGIYYLAVALGATANNATSANIWRSYPNNFVQSGAYDLNGISNPTSITQQTSTSRDSTTSYMFSSAPDASRPGNYGPKWVGRPMRCVIISP